jgi:hypothetical protein
VDVRQPTKLGGARSDVGLRVDLFLESGMLDVSGVEDHHRSGGVSERDG